VDITAPYGSMLEVIQLADRHADRQLGRIQREDRARCLAAIDTHRDLLAQKPARPELRVFVATTSVPWSALVVHVIAAINPTTWR
jgi:hypothetical protein